MSKAGYTAASAAGVALAPATAKSVIGVLAPAQFGVDLTKLRISFDGATSTAIPVSIEICQATFATNAPGTNSTTIAPTQVYGRSIVAGFTAASNWTAEPTVLVVVDAFTLAAYGGTVIWDMPFGASYDNAVSVGFAIRCTAAAAVNCRPTIGFERC
jgi:hypothetical protein